VGRSDRWKAPHDEAVNELGPIRFAERMPPKYKWLWLGSGFGALMLVAGLWIALANALASPPGPGVKPRAAKKMQNESKALVGIGIGFAVMGAFFVAMGAAVFRWCFLAGSYSLHEKGAMAIIWGKEAKIHYDEVDELTSRSQVVTVNGAYVGDAHWVTFASTKLGTPPVRLCHVRDGSTAYKASKGEVGPTEVMTVCTEVAARIAAQIEAALARGESYPFTSTVGLSPGGVVLGKGGREMTLGWGEIERLKIEFGMCRLYKRGEKKSVARWLFQTKNCMPVCMVIHRAVKA
jgi:hypothetical protein